MLLGGVFFNIVLAYFIFSFLVGIGMPADAEDPMWGSAVLDPKLTAIEIIAGSAAQKAGLKTGDIILSLEYGKEAKIYPLSVSDMQRFTREYAGKNINMEIERGSQKLVLNALLADGSGEGAYLGAASAVIGTARAPWYLAPFAGLQITLNVLTRTIYGFFFIFKLLFSGNSVAGFVSGPVGIFSIIAGTFDFGWKFLVSLIAVISVNLAVINLIPFPALDGGRLLFLALEGLRGKPVSRKIGGLAHAFGFAILIMLMAIITYLDVKSRL